MAAIESDADYDLMTRIDRLLDDRFWGNRLARDLWEWQLLVEFLGGVRGYRLADLAREDVTRDRVREQMMSWYREQR